MAISVLDVNLRNASEAFDNAVDTGALSDNPSSATAPFAGNFMYMYSTPRLDYFKHIDTREYLKVAIAA